MKKEEITELTLSFCFPINFGFNLYWHTQRQQYDTGLDAWVERQNSTENIF